MATTRVLIQGVLSPAMDFGKHASPNADPFTGKSARIMKARRDRRKLHHPADGKIDALTTVTEQPSLDEAYESMGSWMQRPNSSWVCATRTTPVKKRSAKKRTGAGEANVGASCPSPCMSPETQ